MEKMDFALRKPMQLPSTYFVITLQLRNTAQENNCALSNKLLFTATVFFFIYFILFFLLLAFSFSHLTFSFHLTVHFCLIFNFIKIKFSFIGNQISHSGFYFLERCMLSLAGLLANFFLMRQTLWAIQKHTSDLFCFLFTL